MKNTYRLLFAFIIISIYSCKSTEEIPVIETGKPSDVAQATAIFSGTIADEGRAEIQSVGILIQKEAQPDMDNYLIKQEAELIGSAFEVRIFGLRVRTTYFARAYAVTTDGVSYGAAQEFNTLYYGFVNDRQNNSYMTVELDGKTWMSENLRATAFSDGTPVVVGLEANDWQTTQLGAYQLYPHQMVEGINDEAEMMQAYRPLYNWHVVNHEAGICPVGWHIPTVDEWNSLEEFLGGADVAGAKLKCSKVDPIPHPRWNAGDSTINNAAGYRGMPGGVVSSQLVFSGLGDMGAVWLAGEASETEGYQFVLTREDPTTGRTSAVKNSGAAIRCVKDN